MATSKRASGDGTIRKKTVNRNGKTYSFWEGRITIGHTLDGKQVQKSFSGKTQAEVRKKMQAAAVEVSNGTYIEPTKQTVAQWIETWQKDYLSNTKPRTKETYKSICGQYIIPALGNAKLCTLRRDQVQKFFNGLTRSRKHGNGTEGKPLSPKTIKNIHSVLREALEVAVRQDIIARNPADKPVLPTCRKTEIKPLNDAEMASFLRVIEGDRYESIYFTTLFTGMREGEVLGLTWDCVDFDNGTLTVKQQLQKTRGSGGQYKLYPTKTSNCRTIYPASAVMDVLKQERATQRENRVRAGELWSNPMGLVFTDELGKNRCNHTIYMQFKRLAARAGFPDARFHDLRHTYATASLRCGDDLKTVQKNLGHSNATTTLNIYMHTLEEMQKESSNRADQMIERLEALKNA